MWPNSVRCSRCIAVDKAALALERRRTRYAEEIECCEWYIRQLTLTDEDYDKYFWYVPRHIVEERLQRTRERLDWLRERCGLR